MLKKNYLIPILCIGLFCGCGKKAVISYSGTPVFDRNDTIRSVVLATDVKIGYPAQMFTIDSIIGIVDMMGADNHFVHLFDENGRPIKKIGRRGRGPGEIAAYWHCFVNRDAKTISFFTSQKIVEYDLGLVFQDSIPYYREILPPVDQGDYVLDGFRLNDDRFFFVGKSENMRFAISDKGQSNPYHGYPTVTKAPHLDREVLGYASRIAFNEGLNRFVQGSYIGGVLEMFQIEGNDIVPQKTAYIYEPVFDTDEATHSHVSWNEETTIGFDGIDCTDDYIYTLLSGYKGADLKAENAPIDPPFTDHISIFDWGGLPVRSVVLDNKLMTIAVKKDNTTAYLVAYDDGYSLLKVTL